MKLIATFFIFPYVVCNAQVDTVNTKNGKLTLPTETSSRYSYVIFFTDSTGNRTTTADIWDREVSVVKETDGKFFYKFGWKAYHKDSLVLESTALCEFPSLQPKEYTSYNKKRQRRVVRYDNSKVTVEGRTRKTQRDTTYDVKINLPAFVFPMDLEILGLLPFKKIGQQFAIPFYEPGTLRASYYNCTVIGKENLQLTADVAVKCWLLKLIYSPQSYAIFWVSESSREILKMKQPTKNGFRYKEKLY